MFSVCLFLCLVLLAFACFGVRLFQCSFVLALVCFGIHLFRCSFVLVLVYFDVRLFWRGAQGWAVVCGSWMIESQLERSY